MKLTSLIGHLVLSVSLLLLVTPAPAAYTQPASTFSAGGGESRSAAYANLGVIGQPGIIGSSGITGGYSANHGFLSVLGDGFKILYPVISATPGTFTFTLASGANDSQAMGISNAGGSTLKWSVAKRNQAESWFSIFPATGTGDAAITVTANAAGLAAGSYSDTLTISGTGISQTVQVLLDLTVTAQSTYLLTVRVVSDTAGKGGGVVQSGTGAIICHAPPAQGDVCEANLAPGTPITLFQTPDTNSTAATWSGACTDTGNCVFAGMDGPKNVTATFPYAFMAKVNSTGTRYDTLTQACAGAAASDTILARDVTFTENFALSGGKAITLNCGMSTGYTPLNAWTTLQGVLTIGTGSLTVDRLIIK